ncbi:MAG: M43 family zinc metalloprotease [Crocinitomicaceae bacterium]
MNKLFTRLFLSLSASILMFGAVAQEKPHKCGTDHELQRLLKEKPELRKKLEKAFSLNHSTLKSYDDSTLYIIPVVFHVLHQNGPERISLTQIQGCLDALNENYRNTNASHANSYYTFDTLRGDAKIEFRLAQIDPYGNCTNGVDYVYTSETMIGDNNSKLNQWDRSKYLNIWTVNSFARGGGLLGFSMFPDAVSEGTFYMDGVMMLYSEVNTFSTTLTHEIGHYLNLAHPWGFDNDPEVACGDDGVTDTPITKGFQSVCPAMSVNSSRTCTTVDHTIGMDFDSVRTDNGVKDLTINDAGKEVYVENLVYNGTALNSSVDSSFIFSNWSIGAVDGDNDYANQSGNIDLNNYFETRVSVKGNNLLNINKLSFVLSRSDNGARSVALRSSVDNFSSNITMTSLNTLIAQDNSTTLDNTIFFNDTTANALVEASLTSTPYLDLTDQDTVTFRFYAWNSEDVNGTFGLDSVTVRLKTGIIENIENYMDYANCPKMFTKEQIVRMRTALASSTSERNNLFSAENLIATGVNDDYVAGLCSPVADFYATAKTVCMDENISFYESAWGGTVADYTWSFEGATPATSTSQNPTVKFDNPGYKTVSLIVSNATGSDTLSKTILVTGNWADFVGPKLIDFEDDYKYWFVPVNEYENETSFALAYGMGYNNSDCYVLQNFKDVSMAPSYSSDYFYNDRLGNDVDYLFSPSFDLRNTSGVTIKFKYAYATNGTVLTANSTQDADITEKMRVYAVRDCATSLGSPKKTISGAELLTAGFSSNMNFVPNSESQWKDFSLNYSASSTLDGNVRFVIAFESSDVSNNLYIDDFFVDGFLGIEQQEISDMNLSVYPNPLNSNESINVSYIAGNNPVELVLRNAQGQVIYNTTVKTTNAQVNHSINVGSKLPAACYFLEVKNGEFKTIRKVIVM